MKQLTFIVPCYNEEKNVAVFYKDIEKSFENIKINIELIFINDGSKDNTLKELKKLLKNKKMKIKVINFSRNFGKEAAIYAGLKNSTGDYVVIIDADMQQPPHLVIHMLNVIEENENVDIVAYYQEDRIENKLISFLKKNFYKLINRLTKLKIKNGASDFRLFRREVANTIIELSEHNRFSKGIFTWIGYETKYLPYIPEKRMNGKSSWSLVGLFKYAISGMLSYLQVHKLIFNIGIFSMLISIIWFVVALIVTNSLLNIQNIFIFILFMFGLNFTFIGIVGEYVYRSYDEVRNRPIYIIKGLETNE